MPANELEYFARFDRAPLEGYGLVVADRDGTIRLASKGHPLEKEFGPLVGQNLNKVFFDLLADSPEARKGFDELRKRKRAFSLSSEYSGKDGSYSGVVAFGHEFSEGKGGVAVHSVHLDAPQDLKSLSVEALRRAVILHDPQIRNHGRLVSYLSGVTADELGMPPKKRDALVRAALLHDVGKLVVPTGVLAKRHGLTAKEHSKIYPHPEVGEMLVRGVFGDEVAKIVGAHHMRAKGTNGYPVPEGIIPGNPPLEARLLKVADAYAVIRSKRDYKAAGSHECAMKELKAGVESGEFDPAVVAAFKRAVESKPKVIARAFKAFLPA